MSPLNPSVERVPRGSRRSPSRVRPKGPDPEDHGSEKRDASVRVHARFPTFRGNGLVLFLGPSPHRSCDLGSAGSVDRSKGPPRHSFRISFFELPRGSAGRVELRVCDGLTRRLEGAATFAPVITRLRRATCGEHRVTVRRERWAGEGQMAVGEAGTALATKRPCACAPGAYAGRRG